MPRNLKAWGGGRLRPYASSSSVTQKWVKIPILPYSSHVMLQMFFDIRDQLGNKDPCPGLVSVLNVGRRK